MTLPAPAAVRTSGRDLARDTLLNLLGQGVPLFAALVSVPLLIRGLGTERFGLLTLGWVVLGYFSLFDLGLGRALTQAIAARRGEGRHHTVAPLARAALRLMLVLGGAGAVVTFVLAGPLASRWLDVSPALRGEALQSFRLLAVAIPVVVVSTGVRGVLEAYQRFDLVNVVRLPLGIANYLAPLAVLGVTRNLAATVAVLLVARVLALVAHWVMCRRIVAGWRSRRSGDPEASAMLRGLVRTGGWMMVSNLVSPIMSTLDRFLLGAAASAAVVAFYTAPQELVMKLMIVPAAIAGAVFPVFAARQAVGHAAADGSEAAATLARAAALTGALLLPVVLVLGAFATEILTLWMDAAFAVEAAPVLRLLVGGVFVNCVAQVAHALVQAGGYARQAALLHLLEVPVFVAGAWHLMGAQGAAGAALAWSIRNAVDAVAMLALARKVAAPAFRGARLRTWLALALASVAVAAAPAMVEWVAAARMGFVVMACALFAALGWRELAVPLMRVYAGRTGRVSGVSR